MLNSVYKFPFYYTQKKGGIVPDLINSLVDQIVSINKLQRHFLEYSVLELSKEDMELLKAYINYCVNNGMTLSFLSRSYDLISKDTFREQMYFKRHKKYRYSTYDQVCSSVYNNDKYMKMYMHGLALTSFLWPNHAKIMQYFRKSISNTSGINYIEIGPGHGFYFMEAMRLSKYEKYNAVDISSASVLMTNAILQSGHFGQFSNYEVEECDFINWNCNEKYDAVVMGEVLEHVEKPKDFLKKIYAITHSCSYIFITTCINSPAIDHIYLFESYDHIKSIIEDCNLYVKSNILLPYNNLSLEESKENELPINVAFILGKVDE